MRRNLTWPQILAAAPLFGAMIGFGRYVWDRVFPGAAPPATAAESLGAGLSAAVIVFMGLWLFSYVQFSRGGAGADRP